MKNKRKIIIGDIHGCLTELKELLANLKFSIGTDDLICVGDLVERGPDSTGVVKFVRNFGQAVCGNHDHKMIKYHMHQKILATNKNYKNPMYLSPDKQKVYDNLSDDDLEWLTALPKKLYIKEHNILVIHAGLMPRLHPLQQDENTYMYCRYLDEKTNKQVHLNKDFTQPTGSKFWTELYNYDIDVVYGHEVHSLDAPRIETNICGAKTYGIDTGCVFGGHLTALVIDNDSGNRYIKQIEAKQKYFGDRK